MQHKPHPIAAGPPLIVCTQTDIFLYCRASLCCLRCLIIFSAVEVFLVVRTDHQSDQSLPYSCCPDHFDATVWSNVTSAYPTVRCGGTNRTVVRSSVIVCFARCPHLKLKSCAVCTARCPDHFCSRWGFLLVYYYSGTVLSVPTLFSSFRTAVGRVQPDI